MAAAAGEEVRTSGVHTIFEDFDPMLSFNLDVGDGHSELPDLDLFPSIDHEEGLSRNSIDHNKLGSSVRSRNNYGDGHSGVPVTVSEQFPYINVATSKELTQSELDPLQPNQEIQPANAGVLGQVIPMLQLDDFLESDSEDKMLKTVSNSFHHLMTIGKSEAERLKNLDRQLQRLNHMRVERNKRKEMNQNIAVLKAMLPSNSKQVTKNDQASVISGVVDYIKALQQEYETLNERKAQKGILSPGYSSNSCLTVSSSAITPQDGASPAEVAIASSSAVQQVYGIHSRDKTDDACQGYEIDDCWAHVLVTRAGKGVGVLIETHSRPRQLTEFVMALQSLYLDVFEMNVGKHAENSKELHVFFKTMIADGADCSDCRFSVKELAKTIHQITISIAYSLRAPQ